MHRALLNRVLLGKWKEARRRLRKNNGFVGRPTDIKIPPPDRIEQINLIVKAWKNTNTADIEAKTEEVRMKCYALAQETGWTPAKAFEDMPMDAELAAQVQEIHAHDQQVQGDIDNQETRTLTCLTKKCVREAVYNFTDQSIAKYCETHKMEGMVPVRRKQAVKGGKGGKGTETDTQTPQGEKGGKGGETGTQSVQGGKGGKQSETGTQKKSTKKGKISQRKKVQDGPPWRLKFQHP